MDEPRSDPGGVAGVGRLDVRELRRRLDAGRPVRLLDVREPFERALAAIPAPGAGAGGDWLVPLGSLVERFPGLRAELEAGEGPLVVYCHHGVRSLMAARWLAAQGVHDVHNLDGGIDVYSLAVDPTVPRY